MPRGSGSVPLPAPGLPDPPPASVCPQPAASAALYAQLVRGQKGLEAVETLGRLLAHIEQSLSRRGTAYLAGVSGTTGQGQPCSQKGVGPLLPADLSWLLPALRQSPGLGSGLPQGLTLLLWPRTPSQWLMWLCGVPCSLSSGMRPACQVRVK